MVAHLKSKKILAARFKHLDDIPLIKAANGHSPEERFDLVLNRLQQMKASKPRAVKTLRSTVSAVFQKQINPTELVAEIEKLINERWAAQSSETIDNALGA